MRVEITRTQYEELQRSNQPGVQLDMECKYWMTFVPHTPAKAGPRKRRSPLSLLARGPKWERFSNRHVINETKKAVAEFIKDADDYMASAELAEKLSEKSGITKDAASHRISSLINLKILVVLE